MFDLTAEFMNQLGFNPVKEYEPIKYNSDYSEFIVVDGEEGDYGVIKHFPENKILLAITIVNGGDDEDTQFTQYGKALCTATVINALEDCLTYIYTTNGEAT